MDKYKKIEAEKAAQSFIDALPNGAIEEFKNAYLALISEQEVTLSALQKQKSDLENEQKSDLENERKILYDEEKAIGYDKIKMERRMALGLQIKKVVSLITNQENVVVAIKNNGDLVNFTDKKDDKHINIPSFIKVNTETISFDEDTILADEKPIYIPSIDEEVFKQKGYIFDSIRIAPDEYILASNGYKERVSTSNTDFSNEQKYYLPTSAEQGFILVTLDQLVLINDYYYIKAKAVAKKYAEDKNSRTEAHYDSLSLERRGAFLNQKNFYSSLPSAIKKKISQTEYEVLGIEEKEKLYKPYKRYGAKRLVSKLNENQMWVSFHEMYERFLNPEALPINKNRQPIPLGSSRFGAYGNEEVFAYWYTFSDMMKWKLNDIKVQREIESENYKTAIETSFGESNTNDILYSQYGILVKRQNGDAINPEEIEQIRKAIYAVESKFGVIKDFAIKKGLKISHTGNKLVFASKAAGMYISKKGTISVSAKFGANQFENILAHESAHFIDNVIGSEDGKRYMTDNYESLAGEIAFFMRKNMNTKTDSDYVNATKECFARALEQYFAIETHGENAELFQSNEMSSISTYFTADSYLSKLNYTTIKPMIEKFLEQTLVKEINNNLNQKENGISQRVSQGNNRTNAEVNRGNEEIASELRERIRKAQGDAEIGEGSREDSRTIDNKITYEFAKETDTWIENLHNLGHPFIGGNENTSVLNENENKVYKSNNLFSTISIDKFLDKIRLHNLFFPNTHYTFVGFTGIKDTGTGKPYVEPVYSQNLIKDSEYASPQEISEYMENLGFEKISVSRFKRDNVEVWDLHTRNVLKDKHGDIYVIDAEFKELKPQKIEQKEMAKENKVSIPQGNEELKYLLNDKGAIDFIGHEIGKKQKNGISVYKTDNGSYRYVKYENEIPLSAIQIMSKDGKKGEIANVYTVPKLRQKGYATELLNKAKQDFENIKHSELDKSQLGELFAKSAMKKETKKWIDDIMLSTAIKEYENSSKSKKEELIKELQDKIKFGEGQLKHYEDRMDSLSGIEQMSYETIKTKVETAKAFLKVIDILVDVNAVLPENIFLYVDKDAEKPEKHWFYKTKNGYETIKFLSGNQYTKTFEEVKEALKSEEQPKNTYKEPITTEEPIIEPKQKNTVLDYAIKDIIHLHPDRKFGNLDFAEAKFLYSLKDKEKIENDFSNVELKEVVLETLFNYGYLENEEQLSYNEYVLSDKGKEFISAIDARIETLSNIETDLFPQDVNAPDLEEERIYPDIKSCLMEEGDEGVYIFEGKQIINLETDKKDIWEIISFFKYGVVLSHVVKAVKLTDKKDNKRLTFNEIISLYKDGFIEINGISDLSQLTHCLKLVSKCIDLIDANSKLEDEKDELSNTKSLLDEYEAKEIEALKQAKVNNENKSILNQDTDLYGEPKEVWMYEIGKMDYWGNGENLIGAKPVVLGIAGNFMSKRNTAQGWLVVDGESGIIISRGKTLKLAIETANGLFKKNSIKNYEQIKDLAKKSKSNYEENTHKPAISRALSKGLSSRNDFEQAIFDGTMTIDDAIAIIKSANKEVPESILEIKELISEPTSEPETYIPNIETLLDTKFISPKGNVVYIHANHYPDNKTAKYALYLEGTKQQSYSELSELMVDYNNLVDSYIKKGYKIEKEPISETPIVQDSIKIIIDKQFNVSGKYKDIPRNDWSYGIKRIYTDGIYAGKNVVKSVQKDAEKLYEALVNGEVYKIKEINDKYFREWNKSKTAGTQRDRFIRIDTAKVELYNKSNDVLIYLDKLNAVETPKQSDVIQNSSDTQEAIELLTELLEIQEGKEKEETLEAIEFLKELL